MSDFIAGTKGTEDGNSADVILDLKEGLKYLNPKNDGIGLLKKLGMDKFNYANQKIEWSEVALALRKFAITITNVATSLTVPNARAIQINTLLKCENEVMRVTAITGATTVTVARGYMGTTVAAHTAKVCVTLGTADPQGADAPAGVSDDGDRLYNFSQTFTRGISLTNDEIAQLSTEGNPMTGQVKRRYIEMMREIFQSIIYGVRGYDSTNNIHSMGGWKQFVTTNVTNLSGAAVSAAAIDAIILAQVQAGADPNMIALSPYQKQKLDALDNNKQLLGKRERTGGGLVTNTWQSGVLDHEIDVFVDHTFLDDELWIGDVSPTTIEIGTKSHNGINGAAKVVDSTPPGADRKSQVIRAKHSQRINLEKGLGYIYGAA